MAENHVLLETIELTQSAATVTFDNLPSSGYTDLKIIISARCTDTTPNKWVAGYLRFNGDSSNLTSITNAGRWSSVDSFTDGSTAYCFWLSGSDTTANSFGVTEITIPDYLSTSQNKLYSSDWAEANNDTFYQILGHSGGRWSSNSAITSVTLIPQAGSIASGSTFSLYGIAALGTTPTVAPKATGGNMVANDGTYWYHTFLSSGTFTPQANLTGVNYLIVGGGGGPGFVNTPASYASGGGGAGGLRQFSSQSLTTINYSVVVGAGGGPGSNGSSSALGSVLASGGGRGGNGGTTALTSAQSGGSGGGGGSNASTTGASGNSGGYSPAEGYAGANGTGSASGGGGGSASAASGTSGGSGTASSISGSSVTYAAGGNGRNNQAGGSVVATTFGAGNGGNAGMSQYYDGSTANAGIVIIRYPML